MIAFGWDTNVPPTPVQRIARTVLVSSCAALAVGVVAAARLVHRGDPPTRFVAAEHARPSPPADFAAMASAPDVIAARTVPAELIHDVRPVFAPPAVAPPAAGQRVVWMVVTAYCPCSKCCGVGAKGVTASGRPTSANYGHFVAAPAGFAFNTKISIPGYNGGHAVPVLDRGGAIKDEHLDVFFTTHEQAKRWGRKFLAVTVTDVTKAR